MKEELARTRKLAGLVSLEGKGAVVRVVDNPIITPPPVEGEMNVQAGEAQTGYVIDDEDLRWLANSLFANGAKAV
ncbi:DUF881 domain-containing protein, partial [Microbacteriaceae bacterium K1510]|nr:DUF881 domain-containing protein [Microbacteriaceae bacterium K1510]